MGINTITTTVIISITMGIMATRMKSLSIRDISTSASPFSKETFHNAPSPSASVVRLAVEKQL
jgi:hypothetical protein